MSGGCCSRGTTNRNSNFSTVQRKEVVSSPTSMITYYDICVHFDNSSDMIPLNSYQIDFNIWIRQWKSGISELKKAWKNFVYFIRFHVQTDSLVAPNGTRYSNRCLRVLKMGDAKPVIPDSFGNRMDGVLAHICTNHNGAISSPIQILISFQDLTFIEALLSFHAQV